MLNLNFEKICRRGKSVFRLAPVLNLGSQYSKAVFFGPSGSGKTLTLQCIAGLVEPDQGLIQTGGKVFFDSVAKINLSPQRRHTGYLFQDYALFPQLNVCQNIAYSRTGLFCRHVPGKVAQEVNELLGSFGIPDLGAHYPDEISGGQKQRVGLARAVFSRPEILLLDEPFSALDPLLRRHMREEISSLLARFSLPLIIITHDPDDVDMFAGAVVLFNKGQCAFIENYHVLRSGYANATDCLQDLQRKTWGE